MPIHDQGYRRYRGDRTPSGRAWAVIAAVGLRSYLGRRAFLALLILAWLPFVIRAVQIFVATNVPQATFLAPTAEMFRDFLDQQQAFVFFITVYAGAGLIANDRRANALQIYLAKPLTRSQYVLGKLAILTACLLFVTWVPATALLVVQVLFAGNLTFLTGNLHLFPAITLFCLLEAMMVGMPMLALSSLSNSSRYAGILFAAVVFFTPAVVGVLRLVTGGTAVAWISFQANLSQVGSAIFGLPPAYETPWPVSLLVIGTLVVASAAILERCVRAVEIVA